VKKVYSKTPKLSAARFRGQKALVVEALSTFSTPVTLETLAPLVDRDGRYNALLNEWARVNGGVKGSVLYHLRALKRLGMVAETFGTASVKTQIVGWGNSQALRIPRALLEDCRSGKGTRWRCQWRTGASQCDLSVQNSRWSPWWQRSLRRTATRRLIGASLLAVKYGKRALRLRDWPHY
jgi:hypothetical protein